MSTCHNCTFYNIIPERHVSDTYEVVHRFTNIVASILPGVTKHWSMYFGRYLIVNDRIIGGLLCDVGKVLVKYGRRRNARVGECSEPLPSLQLCHTLNEQSPFRRFSYITPHFQPLHGVASATSQAFHLRHLASRPWTDCNFTIKNLS